MNNNKEIAELLLSYGANIDEKDELRRTALHIAAENNNKELTELLISYCTNINQKDEYEKSCFSHCSI
ncbi:hypothetical protein TVAG_373550 [Trichomonas vaginalis G3]|uniref:Uncharacterized protein n=1 Tax=Trichomonas vaginalis (strain ATCC PRA-98 / G3) TaxID=412133 RepID=A2FQP7_TRIV3|nr:proteasome regulatory particle assembly [Trichomonas vaginalis G3]EAX92756.1 hypothetical protein TVAG_373550 [Trichomonas vaginalis G3]KAI5498750.1 proteasome regulatory particle assembly [Trichomonas vaginalis G3]|eukprot:XP_001305686.1 hypothetical protein [Trichomonas vaginalis G3]